MKTLYAILWGIFILNGSGIFSQSLNVAKMDSLLNSFDTNNKSMLSIAVSQKGQVTYKRSIGFLSLEDHNPIASSNITRYRIGSVSKLFTSIIIHQLIEEKKLQHGTLLSKYFPKIPNAKKITIEQLLRHRSGLYDFTSDPAFMTYHTQSKTQKELLDIFYSQKPIFEPDQKMEYCNTGFVLLGFIIEKITKKSYAEVLQERICNKIKLMNTYFGTKTNVEKNEAKSYTYINNSWVVSPESDMSIPHGAGAVVSTVEDLVKFIEAIFSHQLVSKTSLDQMTTLKDIWGLGIYVFRGLNHTGYGHQGRIDAFFTTLVHFPTDSLTVAVATNGQNGQNDTFLKGVLSICFDQPYRIPDFIEYKVPDHILNTYIGSYHNSTMKTDFMVSSSNGTLVMQASGQPAFNVEAENDSVFKFNLANISVVFKRNTEAYANQFVLKQAGMEFIFDRRK